MTIRKNTYLCRNQTIKNIYLSCSACQSTNIKKNGFTHYKKQNYRCKCCGRQFVLQNTHHKSEALKSLIKKSLKERLSLHGICRIFSVSMNWLKDFARKLWQETPRNIGITPSEADKIKKLQVFGIQADELWSFVGKKQKNAGFG